MEQGEEIRGHGMASTNSLGKPEPDHAQEAEDRQRAAHAFCDEFEGKVMRFDTEEALHAEWLDEVAKRLLVGDLADEILRAVADRQAKLTRAVERALAQTRAHHTAAARALVRLKAAYGGFKKEIYR